MTTGTGSTSATAVPATGLTTVLDVLVPSAATRLAVELHNGAGAALDACQVLAKVHADGAFVAVVGGAAGTTATDYSTPKWPYLGPSVSPVALEESTKAMLLLDVTSMYAVQVKVSADTNPASVSTYYRFQ